MSSPAHPAPPPRKSRAGRDLPAAIGVGVGLGAVVILSLVFVKALFVVVVVAAGTIAVIEVSRALSTDGISVPVVPVAVGGGAMLVAAYPGGTEGVAVAAAMTVVAVMLWRLPDGADGFVRDVTAGVFVMGYIPLLGSFVVLMLAEPDGIWRIVAFVVVTISSDIAGYAAGATLGRHPMAPTISPKKSWEGFAGSVAGCMLAGVLVVVLALDGPWWAGLVLGGAAVLAATLGDLCESLIKRDLGIKDMSDILPGHGGLMDRLDSLLVVAPFAWIVLNYLVPA